MVNAVTHRMARWNCESAASKRRFLQKEESEEEEREEEEEGEEEEEEEGEERGERWCAR
jgi:hypothetical protein